MKRKLVKQLLCASAAAAMVLGTPMAIMAEAQTGTAETEEAVETETPSEAEEKEAVIEDVVIPTASGDVTVENKTEKNYTVEYAEAEKEAEEGAEKTEEPEKIRVLTLIDDEGQKYIFEDVKPEEWKEAVLVNELGILYIFCKDASGAEKEAAEKCEEKELEEKTAIYTVTNVNIREGADTDAKILKVSTLGEMFTAVAALPGWVKVELPDGKEGFISHKYVTADTELIEKLKKEAEEAAARARAEAEAAAQAQAEAAAQWQAQQQVQEPVQEPVEEEIPSVPEEQPVYEVSREKFDDCDGSGHGYYEITYSDGSVAYEEY